MKKTTSTKNLRPFLKVYYFADFVDDFKVIHNAEAAEVLDLLKPGVREGETGIHFGVGI